MHDKNRRQGYERARHMPEERGASTNRGRGILKWAKGFGAGRCIKADYKGREGKTKKKSALREVKGIGETCSRSRRKSSSKEKEQDEIVWGGDGSSQKEGRKSAKSERSLGDFPEKRGKFKQAASKTQNMRVGQGRRKGGKESPRL